MDEHQRRSLAPEKISAPVSARVDFRKPSLPFERLQAFRVNEAFPAFRSFVALRNGATRSE